MDHEFVFMLARTPFLARTHHALPPAACKSVSTVSGVKPCDLILWRPECHSPLRPALPQTSSLQLRCQSSARQPILSSYSRSSWWHRTRHPLPRMIFCDCGLRRLQHLQMPPRMIFCDGIGGPMGHKQFLRASMYTYAYASVRVCVCIYAQTYIYIYICLYTYVHTYAMDVDSHCAWGVASECSCTYGEAPDGHPYWMH